MFSNEKVLIGKNKEFDPRKTGNLNTQVLENNWKSQKYAKQEGYLSIRSPLPNLDSIRSKLLFSIHFLFRSRAVCYPWG